MGSMSRLIEYKRKQTMGEDMGFEELLVDAIYAINTSYNRSIGETICCTEMTPLLQPFRSSNRKCLKQPHRTTVRLGRHLSICCTERTPLSQPFRSSNRTCLKKPAERT
eukprot:CFRG8665